MAILLPVDRFRYVEATEKTWRRFVRFNVLYGQILTTSMIASSVRQSEREITEWNVGTRIYLRQSKSSTVRHWRNVTGILFEECC